MARSKVLASALRAPLPTARAVGRKGHHALRRVPRAIVRVGASPEDYGQSPPVLVNSFPKSGTHLLWKVATALPSTRDYGAFIASVPPIHHSPRSPRLIARRVGGIAPGEIVRAHLWYDEGTRELLQAKNVFHLFIYRDLRDVAVSEAHYLATMAPWHALHPVYAQLDQQAQIMLSIRGLTQRGIHVPNIAERFACYQRWLQDESVVAVKFEHLIGPQFEDTVDSIREIYGRRTGRSLDRNAFLRKVGDLLANSRSHTFYRGKSGGWREAFTDEHRTAMSAVAGELLVTLGYESSGSW